MAKKYHQTQALPEAATPMLVGFGFGVVITCAVFGLFVLYNQKVSPIKPLRQSDLNPKSQYQFTDPLIGLSNPSDTDLPQYANLESKINTYIAGQGSYGLASASVYFRDISAQGGFTINPDEIYTPASLYKVPLMVAYYKLAEDNPNILSHELLYTGRQDLDAAENSPSATQLSPGESYTVEELIAHMIEYSDNNADQLLLEYLVSSGQDAALTQIFRDLNINFGSLTANADIITVPSYMLFMRVLYNATYLDRTYSEKALELMSKADFTAGLAKPLPAGVLVSHKYGDANIISGQEKTGTELHDCGIIYLPGHPYMLCVMTKGSATFSKLEDVLATISGFVYTDVSARYPYKTQK